MPALHPGAVDGRQGDPPLADLLPQRPLEHGVEHLAGRGGRQEALGGLLEGGEVGDGLQVDQASQVGVVGQVLGQAAVVEAENSLSTRQARSWGWVNFLGLNRCRCAGRAWQAAS